MGVSAVGAAVFFRAGRVHADFSAGTGDRAACGGHAADAAGRRREALACGGGCARSSLRDASCGRAMALVERGLAQTEAAAPVHALAGAGAFCVLIAERGPAVPVAYRAADADARAGNQNHERKRGAAPRLRGVLTVSSEGLTRLRGGVWIGTN